ncbi:MAG: LysM peptidoglycan-binding domain-containing protein [Syntrophaceae bacterium]
MRKGQPCLCASLVFVCLALLVAGAASAAERYTVKPGDSLHKIAKKHHVSVDSLKEANRLDGNDLRPRQVLIIPGGKSAKKITEKSTAKKKSDTDEAVYVVKKGDTLARVSEKTGVPASEIRKINALQSSKLKTGQRLVLGKPPARADEGDEDLEEAGSMEAGELAGIWDDRERPGEIAPIPLSRWKDPGERDLFVKVVKSYEGVPYKLGGNSMKGIDCSAFTRKVYGIFNIDLPRTAREQLQQGKRVGRDSLDTGDLVFFQTRRNRIHVGVFLGGSEFFHLSSRNRAGKVDSIDSTYFSTRFISGVRLKEADRPAKLESTTVPVPGAPAASPPSPAVSPSAEADHSPGS